MKERGSIDNSNILPIFCIFHNLVLSALQFSVSWSSGHETVFSSPGETEIARGDTANVIINNVQEEN